MCDINSLTCR